MPRPRLDDAWRRVLRVAVQKHWKKQWAIAEDAGITAPTLSRILHAAIARPEMETIARLARALGIGVGRDLLDERGFELTPEELDAVKVGVAALNAALDRARPPLRDARREPNAWTMLKEPTRIPAAYRALGARRVYHAAGDSMIGAGIAPDDILFVRPSQDLREAESKVVVVTLGGALYVKRLALVQGAVVLESMHERYGPIEVYDDEPFTLLGVVVGRFLHFT